MGGTYAFRIRSIDINGQVEAWPANDTAEITVGLPSNCIPDEFENDDSSVSANELLIGEISTRNICGLQDPDWVTVYITEPDYYQFSAFSINGGAATKLTLYAEDGVTLVATGEASGIGTDIRMVRRIENPGRYYLKAEPLDENLVGTEAIYDMQILNVSVVFLPLVSR